MKDLTVILASEDEIISGFASLPVQALQALCERLALYMSPSQLSLCAAYYRAVKKDPTRDELRLLDAIVKDCLLYGRANDVLSSLETKSAPLSKRMNALIADLKGQSRTTPELTLLRALSPTRPVPTVDSDKKEVLLLTTAADTATMANVGLRAVESVAAEGTSTRLTLALPIKSEKLDAPAAPQDVFALLFVPCDEDERVYPVIRDFLEDEQLRPHLHRCVPLPHGALWPTMLRIREGSSVQLDAMLPTDSGERAVCLLRSDAIGMQQLTARAAQYGLSLRTVAKRTSDRTLTLRTESGRSFAFPLAFLQRLTSPRSLTLQLHRKNEPSDLVPAWGRRSLQLGDTAWQRCAIGEAAKPCTLGDYKVIHCTLPLCDELSPDDVTLALVQAAAHLVAAGGDFPTLTMAAAMELGENTSPCTSWAAALGLHHLTHAWSTLGLAPLITRAKGEGSLTVYLIARTVTPTPCATQGTPNVLRLFGLPDAKSSAVPDLDTLASMFSLTSSLLTKGHISGLCPLLGRSAADFLAAMANVQPLATEPDQAELIKPRIGLIVRADASVKEGMPLALHSPESSVCEEDAKACPMIADVPPYYSNVRKNKPYVLIPLLPTSSIPYAVMAQLEHEGAQVELHRIELTHQGCSALAEEISRADVLILSGEIEALTTVLSHRRISHAFGTLQMRGGTVVAVTDGCAALANSTLIGNGLVSPTFDILEGFEQTDVSAPISRAAHALTRDSIPVPCRLFSRALALPSKNEVLPYGMQLLSLATSAEREVILRLGRGERVLLCSDGLDAQLLSNLVRYYR